MRILATVVFLGLAPQIVLGTTEVFTPTDQFTVGTITDIETPQTILGELSRFPHSWQFAVSEPVGVSARLFVTESETEALSFILVKREQRGVSEVGRVTGSDSVWEPYEDPYSRLDLRGSEFLTVTLEPGAYRLEVSSPDNVGAYQLKIGTDEDLSYREQLQHIFITHRHFTGGIRGAFLTWQVITPLVVLISLLIFFYWRRRSLHHA